jgi:hypothetical protein
VAILKIVEQEAGIVWPLNPQIGKHSIWRFTGRVLPSLFPGFFRMVIVTHALTTLEMKIQQDTDNTGKKNEISNKL